MHERTALFLGKELRSLNDLKERIESDIAGLQKRLAEHDDDLAMVKESIAALEQDLGR